MHGPASSQAQLSNGDRVYRWIFTGDTTSTFSGNANGGRAISSTSQCFLQFTVGSLGYISSWSHGGECHRNLIDDYRDESEKWRYCDHVDCL